MNTPASTQYGSVVHAILEAHQDTPGSLLPILHALQDKLGYIPEETLPIIAKAVNLSRAEVYGVVTYYHFFRLTPPPAHIVQICRAEACQARGADTLMAHAEKRLGCKPHEIGMNGQMLLEPIYCLGQCAVGPNLLIDEALLHARVTPEHFDELVVALEGKQS